MINYRELVNGLYTILASTRSNSLKYLKSVDIKIILNHILLLECIRHLPGSRQPWGEGALRT
ncbi:hypothetical protein C8R48DRAFT_705327 [Suillus tomentosus]|nr:hypothetical protein C8R48DRAFT_705327 [Suillus tomentosus]